MAHKENYRSFYFTLRYTVLAFVVIIQEVRVPSPTGHRLKLTGPVLTLDTEVSEEIAHRIAMLFLSDGKSEPPSGAGGRADTPGSGSKTGVGNKSIREYLTDCGATQYPEQMTAIGQYLNEKEGKERFSLKDLLAGFEDAKEAPPKNPHRDLSKAISNGWISGKKDSYYVTGTGTKATASHFTKSESKVKRKKRKKRKTAASKTK